MRAFNYSYLYKTDVNRESPFNSSGTCFSLSKSCKYFKYYFYKSSVNNIYDLETKNSLTIDETLNFVVDAVKSYIKEMGFENFSFDYYIEEENCWFSFESDPTNPWQYLYTCMIISRYCVSGESIYHKKMDEIYRLHIYKNLSVFEAIIKSSILYDYYYYSFCNVGTFVNLDNYRILKDKKSIFKTTSINSDIRANLGGIVIESLNGNTVDEKYDEASKLLDEANSLFIAIDWLELSKNSRYLYNNLNYKFLNILKISFTDILKISDCLKNLNKSFPVKMIMLEGKCYYLDYARIIKCFKLSTEEEFLKELRTILERNLTKSGTRLKKTKEIKQLKLCPFFTRTQLETYINSKNLTEKPLQSWN